MPIGGDHYCANASTINVTWPQVITTSGTSQTPYYPLATVANPDSERDLRSLRDLTPVEWLRRQVEDVCLRAVMA